MGRTRALCLLLISAIIIALLPSLFRLRHTAGDSSVAGSAVCCIGDSLTYGLPDHNRYEDTLLNLLGGSPWEVRNAGIGGNTTTQMLARYQADVLSHNPDWVIIWGGINDVLFHDSSAGLIESNLQSMYTQAQAAGIKVIALYVSPFKGYPNWNNSQQSIVDSVNSWIGGTATDVDQRIDIFSKLEDPARPDYLLPAYSHDGVHLSNIGYDAVAHAIYAALFAVARPSNLAPTDGAISVRLTPTLKSSAFSCSYAGETHAASQWQLWKDSRSLIYDSGTDFTNLTVTTIDSGRLSHSTTYWWHVRYQGSMGLWSDWSAETSFKTTAKDGPPLWIWIVAGVAAVLVLGTVAYLIRRKRPPRQSQRKRIKGLEWLQDWEE